MNPPTSPSKPDRGVRPLRRRFVVVLAAVEAVAFGVGLCVLMMLFPPLPAEPRITISRETTFITAPLDADGFPDYVAAVNARYSRGVTPDNNGAVLLLRAYGPKDVPGDRRAKFFGMLEMKPLPDKGEYFVGQYEFEDRLKAQGVKMPFGAFGIVPADDDRPWTRAEQPLRADWLDLNSRPIQMGIAATRRQRWFFPVLHPHFGGELAAYLAPRQLIRLLLPRGLLSVGERRYNAARDDALALHRLARLSAPTGAGTGYIVAASIQANAFQIDRVLIETGQLDREFALSYQRQLYSLNSFPPPDENVDFHERCQLLHSVIALARGTSPLTDYYSPEGFKSKWERYGDRVRLQLIEWDRVLEFCNESMDRSVRIVRMESPERQRAAQQEFSDECEELRKSAGELEDCLTGLPFSRSARRRATDAVTAWFIGNSEFTRDMITVQHLTRVRYELTLLGLGLAAWRADRGGYPESLAQLVPRYVRRIADDAFTDRPPIYQRSGDGFVLYSVGRNGKDDGGNGREDDDPATDDIVIRVPARTRKPVD